MATYTSAATGLWSAGATWVGGVKPPSGAGHKIVIATGHVVTYDEAGSTYGDDTSTGITVNGTLKGSRAASTDITCRGDLYIAPGGTLDYGTEADPIVWPVVATIKVNDSAAKANNKWGLRTAEAGDWSGLRMWGSSKTRYTQATATAASGDTVFTVADTTGWQIGDFVYCGPPVASPVGVFRAITAVSAGSVTLGASLGSATHVGRYFANMTRNVRVVNADTTYRSHCAVRWSASNTVADIIELGYCEFVLAGGNFSTNAHQGGGLTLSSGSNTAAMPRVLKAMDGVSCHNVNTISGSTVATIYTTTGVSAPIVFNLGATTPHAISSLSAFQGGGYTSATLFINSASATIADIFVGGVGSTIAINSSSGLGAMASALSGVALGFVTGAQGQSTGLVFEDFVFDAISGQIVSGASGTPVSLVRCSLLPLVSGMSDLTKPFSLVVGQFGGVSMLDCTVPSGFEVGYASPNFDLVHPGNELSFANTNNDPDVQQIVRSGGRINRTTATTKRGRSSFGFECWYAAGLSQSFVLKASAGQTVRLLGYVRFDAAYGTGSPPTVTISGLGITPVVFTCTDTADTWYAVDLSATNGQAYDGAFTVTLAATPATPSATAECWFDGIADGRFVTWARHYGFAYNPTAINQVVDPVVLVSEATAAAYTGIAYSGGTLTLTSSHSIRELYDWLKWHECENRLAPIITSGDGATFALDANLTLNGGNLTGAGVLDLGANALTLTSGDTDVIVVTAAGNRVKITAPALISGSRVQVYNVTDAVELYNGTLASTGLTLAAQWLANKTIRLRADHADKLPLQTLGVLTSTGLSFLDVQADDAVYTANAIDGSTVTEFAADGPNVQVDIDDPDGVTSVQRLYAWMQYYQTTSVGIASDFFGAMTATDAASYIIDQAAVDIQLDNVSAFPVRVVGGYLSRKDQSTIIAPASGSIQMDPGKAYVAPVNALTIPAGERVLAIAPSGAWVARG